VKGDFCDGKWSIGIGIDICCADFIAILLRRASDRDVEGPAGCFRLAPTNEECSFFLFRVCKSVHHHIFK
jgi:hypothetical protein